MLHWSHKAFWFSTSLEPQATGWFFFQYVISVFNWLAVNVAFFLWVWSSVVYTWSALWLLATRCFSTIAALIARCMGPTWGPSGADRTQVGPMLAPWTLLSGAVTRVLTPHPYISRREWINHYIKICLTVQWLAIRNKFTTHISHYFYSYKTMSNMTLNVIFVS